MNEEENQNIIKPLECPSENLIVLHKAIFELLSYFVNDVSKKVSGEKQNIDNNK